MVSLYISAAIALAQAAGTPAPVAPAPPRINVVTMPRGPYQPAQPQTSPASWVTSFDYPSQALRAELTGVVLVELHVNRWGSLADCVIAASSGHAILDEETCRLVMRRARFFPATDGEARPIAGKLSMRFAWALPDVPVPPSQTRYRIATDTYPRGPRLENADWAVVRLEDYPADAYARKSEGPSLIALDIDAAGRITACTVRQSSGDPVLDRATCALALKRASFAPGSDMAGRNAAGRVLTGIDWRISAISDRPAPPPRPAILPQIPFRLTGQSSVTFDAHADGTITGCTSSGDRLDGPGRQFFNLCDLVQRYPALRYEPLVDEASNPVDATVTVKFAVDVVQKGNVPGK
ncbi:MAG: energy transducer TonB [Novosphingobium sp.]